MRRVNPAFVLIGAVLITALPCSGQSSADSTRVVLAAWDSMMGSPPYEHPGGATAKVCLDGFQRARSTGQDSMLLVALHRRVRAELERRGHVSVEDNCQPVPATSYGSWMVTGARDPAVVLHIGIPRFGEDGRGEIHMGNVRAGRWGRFILCSLERRETEWHVVQCRTRLVS